jgi:hypothetical protein
LETKIEVQSRFNISRKKRKNTTDNMKISYLTKKGSTKSEYGAA